MNRKKIIIIILVALLLLQQGIHMAKHNYQLGSDMYWSAQTTAGLCRELADNIESMQERIDDGEIEDIEITSRSFDNIVVKSKREFGGDNVPIFNEVMSVYWEQIDDIFNQIVNDPGNKRLLKLFTDEKESKDLAIFKEQLEFMYEALMEFWDRYNAMPNWKRYFVSWKGEREALTEKLRIPELQTP